jgi:hypothetical protein
LGFIDTYNLQSPDAAYLGPIPAGSTVNWIKVWITASTTWLGEDTWFRTVLLVDGNLYYGATQYPITNEYLPTSTTYTTNPETGQPWTLVELDGIQSGGELQGYKSQNPTWMTAARVEVDYDEPSAAETAKIDGLIDGKIDGAIN